MVSRQGNGRVMEGGRFRTGGGMKHSPSDISKRHSPGQVPGGVCLCVSSPCVCVCVCVCVSAPRRPVGWDGMLGWMDGDWDEVLGVGWSRHLHMSGERSNLHARDPPPQTPPSPPAPRFVHKSRNTTRFPRRTEQGKRRSLSRFRVHSPA